MSETLSSIAETDSYNLATIECPWKYDQLLRENAPVYHDKSNDMFVVSSYEMVSEVMLHPDLYSSRYMEKMLSKEPFPPEVMEIYMKGFHLSDALLVSDGDIHERHRHIITKAFSRKRLETLEPIFSQCTSGLLDKLIPTGQMKFREELATPVPMNMLQQQLRVPDADMPRAKEWSRILESGFGGIDKSLERLKYEAEQIVECQQYFAHRITQEMKRIQDTGAGERDDDIITMLAQSILDPVRPMDMSEAISFIINLFPATNGTTIGALTATMHRFTDNPDVQERIAKDPTLISKLIEESMRHEAPTRAFWRKTLQDVTLGGVAIPKDQYILLRISAANRDSCVYENADQFNIDRRMPRQHLNFGTGIHLCAGRFYARHIITDVISQLSKRAKDFRFIEGKNDFKHKPNMLAPAIEELHIEFTPR